jgi:hypothetical protein
MIFINHRINNIKQLSNVPLSNGVEIDIRYHEDNLILHHDPYAHHRSEQTYFEDYLRNWQHKGPMILNIKSEGVEKDCIDLMRKYSISNWFFLDLSMPYFTIYAEKALTGEINGFGPKNLAVRYSEREPLEYALAFAGKADWVWVDCFTRLPLDKAISARLRAAGFKICLVSPELQKHDLDRIHEFRDQILGWNADAVCTKRPDLWGQEITT